jgi:hypothetical protein
MYYIKTLYERMNKFLMSNLAVNAITAGLKVLMVPSFCFVSVSWAFCLPAGDAHHYRTVYVSLRICKQPQGLYF